jgi:dihydroorotate dehydrogenase (NAD+) catalytic subunit
MELTKTDLSLKIGDFRFENPILTASGTYGYNNEYDEFLDVSKIGAIVTKAITLNPRKGNAQPRIKEVSNGMINSIGLENTGIHEFINTKLPVLKEQNINFIVNIAGTSLEEYVEVAKICEDNGIKAIELNVSCPNVKEGCLEFGKDSLELGKLIKKVRNSFNGCLITKLSPNVSSPQEIALVCEKSGSDAISAINTLKGMYVKPFINKGKLEYNFVKGGLSGNCIKPAALSFIYEISQVVNIPIIGMGGISSINDVIEFLAVGCSAVQIGTANFTHPNIAETLISELDNYLKVNNINSFRDLIEGKR